MHIGRSDSNEIFRRELTLADQENACHVSVVPYNSPAYNHTKLKLQPCNMTVAVQIYRNGPEIWNMFLLTPSKRRLLPRNLLIHFYFTRASVLLPVSCYLADLMYMLFGFFHHNSFVFVGERVLCEK